MIDLLDPILGKGHGHSVIPTTEELVGPHVDGFWKEADRSITECELGAASVTGAETPTHIPVSCVFERIVASTVVVFDLPVDWNDGAGVSHTTIKVHPAIPAGDMVVLVSKDFAHHDGVGCSIVDRCKFDFATKTVEATAQVVGVAGVSVVRTPTVARV